MKNLLIIIFCSISIIGCSPINDIEEKAESLDSKNKLKEFCKRESGLVVCNENKKTLEYKYLNLNEILEISIEDWNNETYEYQKEDIDNYKFMKPEADGLMRGDCEDFVITYIQYGVMNGLFKKGSLKWFFGKANGDYHSWIIVKIEGIEYIFDTVSWYGKEIKAGYQENNYEELGVVFSY